MWVRCERLQKKGECVYTLEGELMRIGRKVCKIDGTWMKLFMCMLDFYDKTTTQA